jgi:hypothetical protein
LGFLPFDFWWVLASFGFEGQFFWGFLMLILFGFWFILDLEVSFGVFSCWFYLGLVFSEFGG